MLLGTPTIAGIFRVKKPFIGISPVKNTSKP
jgi:hypothetical protein